MDNQYEEEINLVTLLFKICKRWRILLAAVVVSAVIIGGAKLAVNVSRVSNAGKAEEMTPDDRAAYEAEGEKLERELDRAERSLQLQSEYNEKSMLMKVEPYNEWVGSMTLYIDTTDQAVQGSSGRIGNSAAKIAYAYYDYYNGTFCADVMGRLSFDMEELKYLQEVLEVVFGAKENVFDINLYAITINVTADTKEHCDEMVRAAGEAFQAQYSTVKSSMGEHSLTVSYAASHDMINVDRVQFQLEQKKKETEWKERTIPELKEKYLEWEQKDSAQQTLAAAVKSSIKWVLIGAVLGGFLGAAVLFVMYIFSGRIGSAEDLGYGVSVLAELPARGRRKNGIDKLIYRLFGIVIKESEYDSRVGAMALSLGRMLDAMQLEKGTIVFVGDVKETEVKAFVEQVGKALPAAYKAVAAGGDIIADPENAKAAYEADAVVLVAEQDVTMKKIYAQIRSKLSACKVEVLGAVLFGVESV